MGKEGSGMKWGPGIEARFSERTYFVNLNFELCVLYNYKTKLNFKENF